jgi:hypothetical protein
MVLVGLWVAGCGGSSSPTTSDAAPTPSGAAQCLKNAFNSSNGSTCSADVKPAEQVEQRNQGSTAVQLITSATCVNKVGNEFSCVATNNNGNQTNYDVTYDGKSITYQGQ